MKRLGNLWDELTSFDNLYRAYKKARKGKRSRPSVSEFAFHLEHELIDIQRSLPIQFFSDAGNSVRPGVFNALIPLSMKMPRLLGLCQRLMVRTTHLTENQCRIIDGLI